MDVIEQGYVAFENYKFSFNAKSLFNGRYIYRLGEQAIRLGLPQPDYPYTMTFWGGKKRLSYKPDLT